MGSSLLFAIFALFVVAAIAGTAFVRVRKGTFPRPGYLWMIAVGILSISILLFLLMPTYTSGASTTVGSVSDTAIPGFSEKITWLEPVVKDQPISLTVSLVPVNGASANSATQVAAIPAQLTPVGTPDVPIRNAFGPQYTMSAVAYLNTHAFDITPQVQEKQSFNQSGVVFYWTIIPRDTGAQVLKVSVTGFWVPASGPGNSGAEIERALGTHQVHVDVGGGGIFSSTGRTTLSALAAVLLGLTFNIPWILELLKERLAGCMSRGSKKKDELEQLQPGTRGSLSAQTTPTCSQCGEVIRPNARFCPNCGQRLLA